MVVSTGDLGKSEPAAQFLLERASALALSAGQELDTLHIMLVALTEPEAAGSASQSLSSFLSDETIKTCVGAIRVQLHLNGRPASSPDAITAQLRHCLDLWIAEAQRRSLRVTETLILWAVITGDEVSAQILRTFAVDLYALTHDLERRFEVTSKLPPPRSGQVDEVRNHVEIISPSMGCHFAGAHAVLMSNLLNVLGALDHAEIAILSGYNGTPLHHVEQVLADLLALGTTFSDERPRLQNDYQGVYRLNLAGLRNISSDASKPKPAQVLRAMLEISAQERAILVINDLELLQRQTVGDQELLAELANPGDALVLGLYEMPILGGRGPDEALELANTVNVSAHAYSALQSKTLVRNYYLPQWQEKHKVEFTDDAFDHIIALEPGAWINLRRKTLPYLVVGLASDVIQSILGGESLMHETLVMAIDALDALHEEWATTESRIRDKYEYTLDQAHREITALLDAPMPVVNADGMRVLTRAHVTAQLICPNDSEFHYPGHAPEQLSAHRQEDLPTHIYANYVQTPER